MYRVCRQTFDHGIHQQTVPTANMQILLAGFKWVHVVAAHVFFRGGERGGSADALPHFEAVQQIAETQIVGREALALEHVPPVCVIEGRSFLWVCRMEAVL